MLPCLPALPAPKLLVFLRDRFPKSLPAGRGATDKPHPAGLSRRLPAWPLLDAPRVHNKSFPCKAEYPELRWLPSPKGRAEFAENFLPHIRPELKPLSGAATNSSASLSPAVCARNAMLAAADNESTAPECSDRPLGSCPARRASKNAPTARSNAPAPVPRNRAAEATPARSAVAI